MMVMKDGVCIMESVPGFPKLTHRGFETLTVVSKGTIDHSDSMGATMDWMEMHSGSAPQVMELITQKCFHFLINDQIIF